MAEEKNINKEIETRWINWRNTVHWERWYEEKWDGDPYRFVGILATAFSEQYHMYTIAKFKWHVPRTVRDYAVGPTPNSFKPLPVYMVECRDADLVMSKVETLLYKFKASPVSMQYCGDIRVLSKIIRSVIQHIDDEDELLSLIDNVDPNKQQYVNDYTASVRIEHEKIRVRPRRRRKK